MNKNILKMSSNKINQKLIKKEIKVKELVELQLNHIKDTDKELNSYITLNEENAIKKACEIQEVINKGGLKDSKVVGIPVAIKDNISTKGLRTTAGSKMLENYIPNYNASVIKSLEKAGAIIIGKTNLDEFAMGGSTITSYFGPSKNPINTNYIPGGSSGGTASAIAGYQAFLGLGTDTGGSIRNPAASCGIVGLKPSYGRVSRYGLIDYASSLDQIGPMARNVTDCIDLFNVIYGYDNRDRNMLKNQSFSVSEAKSKNIVGLKIGIAKEFLYENLDEDIYKNMINSISLLKNMGISVEEFHFDALNYVKAIYYIIACAEASSNLGRYKENAFSSTVNKSQGFGFEVKLRSMLGAYVLSGDNYSKYYEKALKIRRLIKNKLEDVFMKYDLIIGPTMPDMVSSFDEVKKRNGDTSTSTKFTALANLVGNPAISIENGHDRRGLPTGLHIIGPAFREELLLKVAYAFEKELKGDNDE